MATSEIYLERLMGYPKRSNSPTVFFLAYNTM
uniref:Uncharacterized protein n=1 Tax=Podoviridae sp. ct8Lf7 TaxID=2827723 RepID=A0A8S5S101_9CAUD|nr:MAG TPA: hypothetical protein [Podoviridae sp. ct8Lf7]